MPTALAFFPHADDVSFFCGGTLAERGAEGWEVVLVRVTNDAKDSVGLTRDETIARNAQEFRDAAAALGATAVVDLNFETDALADVPLGELRERAVYFIRKYRPFSVFTFDPYAPYEPNQDHVRTAQAVEEAFWVARFDQHHPEHFDDGLMPCAVCEQWYFARHLSQPNCVEDVTAHAAKKIAAACAHRTMVDNIVNQCRMMLESWNQSASDTVRNALQGDAHALVGDMLSRHMAETARAAGLKHGAMAEAFRVVRFGDMHGIFESLGIDTTP